MKNLKNVFAKLAGVYRESVALGTMSSVLLFDVLCLLYYLKSGDSTVLDFLLVLLVMNLIFVITAIVLRYFRNFHEYDQELIGNNFVGISKKCKLFKSSLELFHTRYYNKALNGFKAIEKDYASELKDSEFAVLSFYMARCYDNMAYYSNALKYYNLSAKQGFSNDALIFLSARCTGALGDISEAVGLYEQILSDQRNIYLNFVRTDIGRMFLSQDNAKEAKKWFIEAIDKRQNYAEALGGAAIAELLLHNFDAAEKYHRLALLNRISDSTNYITYYREVRENEISKAFSG